MQLINLNITQMILADIAAWVFFHLGIGYSCSKIPLGWLNPGRPFFQTFEWEKDGRIYNQLFRVRSWKAIIPNGSALYKDGYSIRQLTATDQAHLERWLKETVRAEPCHWLMILPGFLFFLWNNVMLGWLMVAYAFLNNLPLIFVQRFNRPRVRKMLKIVEKRNQKISRAQ